MKQQAYALAVSVLAVSIPAFANAEQSNQSNISQKAPNIPQYWSRLVNGPDVKFPYPQGVGFSNMGQLVDWYRPPPEPTLVPSNGFTRVEE